MRRQWFQCHNPASNYAYSKTFDSFVSRWWVCKWNICPYILKLTCNLHWEKCCCLRHQAGSVWVSSIIGREVCFLHTWNRIRHPGRDNSGVWNKTVSRSFSGHSYSLALAVVSQDVRLLAQFWPPSNYWQQCTLARPTAMTPVALPGCSVLHLYCPINFDPVQGQRTVVQRVHDILSCSLIIPWKTT